MATCCHSRMRPGPRRATGGISCGSAGTWPATSSPWARRYLTWARQHTFVRMEDLTAPYAAAICEHLQVEDRQSTSAQSQFLDACRSRNRGELDAGAARLRERHRRLPYQPRRPAHPNQFLRGGATSRSNLWRKRAQLHGQPAAYCDESTRPVTSAASAICVR